MKPNALSLALALCLSTPLACIAQATPSAAATAHVADVARAQANAAKLASDAARLASERAAVRPGACAGAPHPAGIAAPSAPAAPSTSSLSRACIAHSSA